MFSSVKTGVVIWSYQKSIPQVEKRKGRHGRCDVVAKGQKHFFQRETDWKKALETSD